MPAELEECWLWHPCCLILHKADYNAEYDSLTDYAEQFIDDCYADSLKNLPEFIRYHIDYDGIARDMELGGEVLSLECEGRIHVFCANI